MREREEEEEEEGGGTDRLAKLDALLVVPPALGAAELPRVAAELWVADLGEGGLAVRVVHGRLGGRDGRRGRVRGGGGGVGAECGCAAEGGPGEHGGGARVGRGGDRGEMRTTTEEEEERVGSRLISPPHLHLLQ